jgi:epoxyqueuosine reductase
VLSSETIKEKAFRYGADICGVAPVARFVDAPAGFHPRDIYPGCESVLVFGSRFPTGTFEAQTNCPYTFVRNRMVDKVDGISFRLSGDLESEGVVAIPIPSAEPYDYWDPDRSHGRGILSLKHAGVRAGLGVMGKNTLLLNETYGNMIWLGAVLVPVELEPDPLASYAGCPSECTLCLELCPQQALDGTTIDQELCRARSVSSTDGGGWVLSCNVCRKVCPNYAGLRRLKQFR